MLTIALSAPSSRHCNVPQSRYRLSLVAIVTPAIVTLVLFSGVVLDRVIAVILSVSLLVIWMIRFVHSTDPPYSMVARCGDVVIVSDWAACPISAVPSPQVQVLSPQVQAVGVQTIPYQYCAAVRNVRVTGTQVVCSQVLIATLSTSRANCQRIE